MLYNILRNRLSTRFNKDFSKWLFENKKDSAKENHHILKSFKGMKKINDLLQASINPAFHNEITYKREPTEDEFIDMLISAIENNADYIEFLQLENKRLLQEIENQNEVINLQQKQLSS